MCLSVCLVLSVRLRCSVSLCDTVNSVRSVPVDSVRSVAVGPLWRRLLDMIDHQYVNRSGLQVQLESELFLDRSEEGWTDVR